MTEHALVSMPFKVVGDLVENGKSRLGDDWQKSL